MGKLLVVDGCLRAPETSRTKRLAEHFLAALCAACPGLEREDKRLIDMPLHPYAGEELEAREALSRLGRTDDPIFAEARAFAAADVIAVAAPFWDLGLPALVKVYIETVCAPGITFSYRPDGPRCRASRLVYITTRGGIYARGELAWQEMGSRYLQALCGMWGIPRYDCLYAEGLDIEGNDAGALLKEAFARADALAKTFQKPD